MEDLSQYSSLNEGRPFEMGRGDAIYGKHENRHQEGTKAHAAYEQGHKETSQRLKMEQEVKRHSQR